MRNTALELIGVALVAGALAFVHIGFSLALVGVYLFATGVINELAAGRVQSEQVGEGVHGNNNE